MNTLASFKSTLAAHPDKDVLFLLPDGASVPANFHITEVGLVRKDFIDCGGAPHSTNSCVLQAWVSDCDPEHRLTAAKLLSIIQLANALFPNSDLPVELEYQAPSISQFLVESTETTADTLVFQLAAKHTDCLAKSACGLEPKDNKAEPQDCCIIDPVSKDCVATCC